MPISHSLARKEEEEDYSEMEDSRSEDFESENSEYEPTYTDADDDDLDKVQSKLSKLSIKRKRNSRDHTKSEVGDCAVSDMEEISLVILNNEDMNNLEQVLKLIDAGQVEKLKLEQCKVYLRKHGLRLTGKKDILIQRIKEHIEILNGGGEKKYPPSSFVLNCKGDACMGDIVMFEQTVYEGYNIASRSACGPPCGTRIVAGRIVKESYGAAKQQHTFTVEVVWTKGQKPLPPLHPLQIKGRNLYKLNTMRQRWEDEAERQRVLNEKHSRGSIARSNREARIQEKEAKKIIKGSRTFPKERQSSRQQKNIEHESEHIAQLQQTVHEPTPKFHVEFKDNFNLGMARFQPPLHLKPNIPTYNAQSSFPSCINHPKSLPGKPAGLSYGSHSGYSQNYFHGNAMSSDKFQQTHQYQMHELCGQNKENVFPKTNLSGYINMATYSRGNVTLSEKPQHLLDSNRAISYGNHQRPSNTQQNVTLSEKPQHLLDSNRAISYGNHQRPSNTQQNVTLSEKPQHLLDSNRAISYGNHQRPSNTQQNVTLSEKPQHLLDSNRAISYGNHQRPSNTQQKLCQYYPQGSCYYGNQCKFLHELDRTYC